MDYEDLISAINHRRDIPKLLNALNLNGSGAEIGVQRGDYSAYLLRYSELATFYSIDFWNHPYKPEVDNLSDYAQAALRLFKFPNRSVIVRMEHAKASELFQPGDLDFIYYDIGYNFDTVSEGINLWWPKVKVGGLFCGHIFNSVVMEDGECRPTTTARDALDKFLDERGLTAHLTTELPGRGTNSWIIRKPFDS